MSYNDIDELFDIGFLEHLTVLDLEGNNIKSLDQLYYIKRCTKLTDLNLKCNPVASELTYYQKLQDHAPRLQFLDDELVLPGHFDKKTEELKLSQRVKTLQTDAGLNSNTLSASERVLVNRLVQLVG